MIAPDENDRFARWFTRFPEWHELGGASRGLITAVAMFLLNLFVALLLAILISLLRGDDDFGSETVAIAVLVGISVLGLLDAITTLTLNRPRRGSDGSGVRFAILLVLSPIWCFVPMMFLYLAAFIHST